MFLRRTLSTLASTVNTLAVLVIIIVLYELGNKKYTTYLGLLGSRVYGFLTDEHIIHSRPTSKAETRETT